MPPTRTFYPGRPFGGDVGPAGAQLLPGRLLCAYYDLGGEGVAFHEAAPRNQGSGMLNPLDGSHLNGFRADEPVGVSHTKGGGIDDHPFGAVRPPLGQLYVGWTSPGNWLRYTVDVTAAGPFTAVLLHTAPHGGAIAVTVDDAPVTGVVEVPPTADPADPVPWRPAHHWAELAFPLPELAPGRHVLTLHTVRTGLMNYAWLDVTGPRREGG